MRIKELEDILTLVDELPEEDQLSIVKRLSLEVQAYEERVSLGMDIIDYADHVSRAFWPPHIIVAYHKETPSHFRQGVDSQYSSLMPRHA